MEGGLSLEFSELCQAPRVGAVQAADDENGVRSGSEGLDFGLSLLRGVADGIENDRLGALLSDAVGDGGVFFHTLRRLGDDTDLAKFREILRLFEGAEDDSRLTGKTQQAVHLRVLPVPGDQNREAGGRMFSDDRLHMGHLRAGGVDDPESLFFDLLSLGGGNAVGADDHDGAGRGAFDLVQVPDRDDAPLPEELDRLGIVDQGAIGVYGLMTLVAGHIQDHVHGPLHPHAESGGICKLYAHSLSPAPPVPMPGSFFRQMKNSRFPAGPVRGDSQLPRTARPKDRQNVSISARTLWWSAESRTTPWFPTSPFSTSNCGLVKAIRSVPSLISLKTGGMISLSEMKEASNTTRSIPSVIPAPS